MVDDGAYTAVVDRIEEDADGESATVLLLEEDEEVLDELIVPVKELAETVEPDAVFKITIESSELVEITYDPDETKNRAGTAQHRFDRLAERSPQDSSDDQDKPE